MCKYSFTSKRLMAKKKIATTCVSMIKRVASTARKKALKDSEAPMVATYARASDVAKIIAGTFFLTCKKY